MSQERLKAEKLRAEMNSERIEILHKEVEVIPQEIVDVEHREILKEQIVVNKEAEQNVVELTERISKLQAHLELQESLRIKSAQQSEELAMMIKQVASTMHQTEQEITTLRSEAEAGGQHD